MRLCRQRQKALSPRPSRPSGPVVDSTSRCRVDGHTAALFPGLTAVSEHERWVMAQYVAEVSMWCVTCTPVLFNATAAANFTEAGGQ